MILKFRVAKRYEITRGEFTYDNAVKKIIEINEIWNPKFIYIDAGHGEYQIEFLKKHGIDHPETGLVQKVKRIHFSEKIEIRDPATNKLDKKDAKNFMINQTSIILERDQISLSPFDDMVWKQMMDYQVVRITQNGKPVYTSENEHALDAFMLTILGFTIEFPDITKVLEKYTPSRKAFVRKNKSLDEIREKMFGGGSDVYQKKPKRVVEEKDDPNWHLEKVSLGYSKKRTKSGRGTLVISRRGSNSSSGFRRSRI